MTVSETPAGTESPLQIRSGPVPGSAGTTGPSEPAAGLQRLHLFNDTTRERLDECDVDDPNNVVFGWEPNHALISINDPRLAVSDDDLAALARLKACRKRQAGHVVQFGNDLGLTASAHADDLLAYLRGEG